MVEEIGKKGGLINNIKSQFRKEMKMKSFNDKPDRSKNWLGIDPDKLAKDPKNLANLQKLAI